MKEKMGLSEADFGKQNDPRKWPELKAKLAGIVATKTQKEWCDLLEGTDVCFAPVLDFLEAPDHDHMKAREAYIEINGMVQPAPAPKFSRTRSQVDPKVESTGASILKEWQVD